MHDIRNRLRNVVEATDRKIQGRGYTRGTEGIVEVATNAPF